MKLDYSVAKQFGSKIPDNRVSTEEIKAGLERIKKAQEQVLLQLKKNHPDSSIDVKNTNFELYHAKKTQNQHLSRQLTVERQKSIEKSSLYRRRVVDLQSSLNAHAQHQQKLNHQNRILSEQNKALEAQNRMLQEQLRSVRQKYRDLQLDYHRLVQQSQKSNKNLRNLQKQVLQFNNRLQEDDIKNLRAQFQTISAERNSMMAEKVNLLKNYSKVQSENIELKTKIGNLLSQQQKQRQQIRQKQQKYERQIESLRLKSIQQEKQMELDQKKKREGEKNSYKSQDVIVILNQINKMNSSHEYIFNNLKSNSKLSHILIQKENFYQNSLNKILEMINILQKNSIGNNGSNQYLFDHDQSFRQEIHRVQNQLIKKHKKELSKLNFEREELISKIKMKDIKIEELQNDNKRQEEKLLQIRKQKKQLMEQISTLSAKVSQLNQIANKRDKQKFKDEQKKQQRNDEEYRAIILQLNSQMGTIQKQKKDLDNLIRSMANSKTEEQQKNKKKLNEIADKNQEISVQNEKIKQKYESILIEKEHLYLNLCQAENKNENLNKEIARELINKQKIISQLNKLRQEKQLHSTEVQKYKLMTQNGKRQIEKVNNNYLIQIQRLVHEGLHLRQQIEVLCKDRNELRELKSRYGLLLKDNKILGQKALHVNSQIDHLWMIKEVEYNNLNKVLNELKPQE